MYLAYQQMLGSHDNYTHSVAFSFLLIWNKAYLFMSKSILCLTRKQQVQITGACTRGTCGMEKVYISYGFSQPAAWVCDRRSLLVPASSRNLCSYWYMHLKNKTVYLFGLFEICCTGCLLYFAQFRSSPSKDLTWINSGENVSIELLKRPNPGKLLKDLLHMQVKQETLLLNRKQLG